MLSPQSPRLISRFVPSRWLCRGLTIHPRITRFYTPSSRTSLKSFWSGMRLPDHPLRFNPEMNQLRTRGRDEDSQITQSLFTHQDHPNNHTPSRSLTTFLQNRNFPSRVTLNVLVFVMGVVLVVMNVRTLTRETNLVLGLLAFITTMSNRVQENARRVTKCFMLG